MTAVSIELNGVKIGVDVEPRLTLADFLRDQCGLTATHLGCEHGACGACTVVVDGEPTRSCLALAVMCDGRSVFTLEGLHNDGLMEIIRRHFHESHALQCGFCTPGMLIMACDILRRYKQPDEQTVRHELSGQICRCTGYSGIVKAIMAAGQELSRITAPLEEPVRPAEEPAPAETEPVVEETGTSVEQTPPPAPEA
jgi:carbon-monoxide dehydrogenase small subunit